MRGGTSVEGVKQKGQEFLELLSSSRAKRNQRRETNTHTLKRTRVRGLSKRCATGRLYKAPTMGTSGFQAEGEAQGF